MFLFDVFFSMSKDKVTKQEMSLFMMFNKSISKQLRVTSYLSPFRISCEREKIYILNYLHSKSNIVIRQFVKTSKDVWIDRSSRFVWILKLEVIHTFTLLPFFFYFKRISMLHALVYVIQKKSILTLASNKQVEMTSYRFISATPFIWQLLLFVINVYWIFIKTIFLLLVKDILFFVNNDYVITLSLIYATI